MTHTIPPETLSIVDNTQIVVPGSIQLMTPYILKEQQDWFEDEIKFLRKVINPKSNIIDIGANYGLYTLTLANKIQEKGRIWSFEPTSQVASFLEKSIETNNFKNITLIKEGLSNHCGTATFFTSPNAELNSLSSNRDSHNSSETITLTTLDECASKFPWDNIDFIKLDAEGEEVKILEGGRQLLSSISPLIMFELKHGNVVNWPLINKFNDLNFQCFHLIPQLDILVPFDPNKTFDVFQLNLFCCKEEKAKELEQEGMLIRTPIEVLDNTLPPNQDQLRWSAYLKNFPYSTSVLSHWISSFNQEKSSEQNSYFRILNSYAQAMSQKHSLPAKIALLTTALKECKSLVELTPTISRQLTLARIAFDLGRRAEAVQSLSKLLNSFNNASPHFHLEPFIPVSKAFESIPPKDSLITWTIASMLYQYEMLHAFSSYYTGKNSLPILQKIIDLGFHIPKIERRISLIHERFNLTK